jgi:hypothetical protein
VSVRRIAAQLGYANGGFLHRRFPDLCHAIAEKLKAGRERRFESLRRAVRGACIEDPPPTLHDLGRRLGFQNSSTLRSWFREETDGLLKARQAHTQQGIAKLRAALLVILACESVPSLSSVARQLGLSASNLSEKCPDLCRAIRSRYQRCRKEKTREREQLLNEEVYHIAKQLHAKGQIPTEPRIMQLLSKGSLRQWGAVRRAVRRARQIL